MQSPPSPRRRGGALRLLLVVAIALAALLAFVTTSAPTTTPAVLQLQRYASPARALLVPPPRSQHHHHRLTLRAVVQEATATPAAAGGSEPPDAVLLPDWEVLVLLHPDAPVVQDQHGGTTGNATCAFPGGAASPARSLGRMPASGRQAYTCAMPRVERRRKPFRAPRLVLQDADEDTASRSQQPELLLRWSGRLVYDAVALDGTGDVLVLAKGVNPRQGVNRNASDVRCVYYRRNATGGDGVVVASVPAATSAQQVFRCPPPPAAPGSTEARLGNLRVTLAVAGEEPIPSMAMAMSREKQQQQQVMVCACTMVRDVAKFLGEWVVYHAAVGVERFYLYDNGSQDDLEGEVRQLVAAGFDVSTRIWPWPKTQEAGFSYAAAAHGDSCRWMAFIDVDEFIFSPRWAQAASPAKSMVRSVVAEQAADVGQVTLGCRDFGPSGKTKHPEEGVTQGYTCRRRAEERHKSVVRLESVEASLLNSVHHFELRRGWRWERSGDARVYHYKYQAWDEFKAKFRRRVSTYVADWTEPVNRGSRDRTPGLGFDPVEPSGWPQSFCDVHDTRLRDVTRRWFGHAGFHHLLRRTKQQQQQQLIRDER